MINAELHKKIPKLELWEDVLTSNIFGLWELLDYKYLLQFLSFSTNIDGEKISSFLENKKIIDIKFWPQYRGIGEPDLVVTLNDNSFFIIEIKYFSNEHNKNIDVSETDIGYIEKGQLDKYLDIEIDNKKNDFIIYLTQDYQSLKYIRDSQSSSKNILNNIYHLHWNELNEYLLKLDSMIGIEKNIVDKMIEYLDFKGFEYWTGFKYEKQYDVEILAKGFYE